MCHFEVWCKMIRKYKGHINDCSNVAINWFVSLYFVFRLTQHYTTSLLVEKYFLRNLVSEKWNIYKYSRGSSELLETLLKEQHIGSVFYMLHIHYAWLWTFRVRMKSLWGCMGSEFYTKLGIKIDTDGIIVTHCGLDLLKVLNIKVPFAHVMGQKLFAVHLIFDCRGKWTFAFATSDGSENMFLHSFDSLIEYFGLLHGRKSIR